MSSRRTDTDHVYSFPSHAHTLHSRSLSICNLKIICTLLICGVVFALVLRASLRSRVGTLPYQAWLNETFDDEIHFLESKFSNGIIQNISTICQDPYIVDIYKGSVKVDFICLHVLDQDQLNTIHSILNKYYSVYSIRPLSKYEYLKFKLKNY